MEGLTIPASPSFMFCCTQGQSQMDCLLEYVCNCYIYACIYVNTCVRSLTDWELSISSEASLQCPAASRKHKIIIIIIKIFIKDEISVETFLGACMHAHAPPPPTHPPIHKTHTHTTHNTHTHTHTTSSPSIQNSIYTQTKTGSKRRLGTDAVIIRCN